MADTAKWAAADGAVTAAERDALAAADSHMAAADAAVYVAFVSTLLAA